MMKLLLAHMLDILRLLWLRASDAALTAREALRTTAGQRSQSFYDMLDTRVFPAIVAYATHRLHILALLVLGIVLLVSGANPGLELVGGNYTNITSALVSCVVLLQQVAHHHEVKQLHQAHADQLDALHATINTLRPLPPKPTTQEGSATTNG